MSDNSELNPQEEQMLIKLIRLAMPEQSDSMPEIDENIIVSYVSGTASDDEKSTVREALSSSSEFRQFILDVTEEVEQAELISESEIIEESKKIEVPSYQDIGSKKSNLEPDAPITEIEEKIVSVKPELAVWYSNLFSRPALSYLATAALILIVYIGLVPDSNQWTVAQEEVDPGLLRSMVTRSPSDTTLYESAKEAAIAEFRNLIEYSNFQFHISTDTERPLITTPFLKISLEIEDEKDDLINIINAEIPVAQLKSSNVQVWFLLLPSRSLYNIDINKGSNQVSWPPVADSVGCVTFTYRDGSSYKAIVGFTVSKSN